MTYQKDDLLRPSIASEIVPLTPYSVTAMFFMGFLGGPLAVIALTTINSKRLQRWRRDLLALSLTTIGFFAFLVALFSTQAGLDFRTFVDDLAGGGGGLRIFIRILGLVFFGMSFLLHRKEQRTADLMGMKRPNPWLIGIACIIGAAVIQFILVSTLVAGEP